MKTRLIFAVLILLSSFQFFSVSAFGQGSLTPPGPPAPTMKTLDQVEARTPIDATHTPGNAANAFIIARAGSYYLTGNLNVTGNFTGIRISAAGVTVDLNGFQIARTGSGNSDGIYLDTLANNCTIKNGSITGFLVGDDGIFAGSSSGGAISHVIASNCDVGLSVGDGWRIDSCTAHDNTRDGIQTGTGCTISHSSASNNGGRGIVTGSGCTVVDCTASANQGSAGISTGEGCTLAHCTARGNTSLLSTSAGISTGNGCTITACTAELNTSTNTTLTGATGAGISAPSGSKVQNCTATLNKGDGIRAQSSCIIVANVCANNGFSGDGAGVHVTSSNNRIEGNNVVFNDRGIDVTGGGCLIIKNSASANTTNYSIVSGNSVGPIQLAGTNAAAINGPASSTATTLVSTDPWANFVY